MRLNALRRVFGGHQTPEPEHDLLIPGLGAHYSYTFDLGPRLNIYSVAHKLLEGNVATIATSPSSDELRVSKGIATSEKHLRESEKFRDFLAEFNSDRPKMRRLLRIHPLLTIRMATIMLSSLVKRTILGTPGGKDRQEESSPNSPHADILRTVSETVENFDRGLLNYSLHGALRVRIEQKTHFPRYFSSEPYLRLALNRVFFRDFLMSGADAIEASLIIHRSGICMITLSAGLAECLDEKGIRECLYSSARRLKWAKLSIPVISQYATSQGIKINKRKIKNMDLESFEGQQWFKLTHDPSPEPPKLDNLTIHTIFEAYLGAVEEAARRNHIDEWHCFTTVSLGKPLCCSGRLAKSNHRETFASLMLRLRMAIDLQESTQDSLLKNHLLISSKELWLSAGNAIYLNWERTSADYLDDLRVVIPIESALLQARQLEQVDKITTNAVIRDRKIFEAQHVLAVGLQEYRRNLLTDPDSAEIVDTLLTKLDAHRLYARLLDRVKTLESVVTSRYSRMQNRRSIAISVAGFSVVLFALLPRISETLDEFSTKGEWPAKFISHVDESLGGRSAAILIIYFSIIIVSLCSILLFSFRWRFKRLGRGSFGRKSSRSYSIIVTEARDDEA